MNFVKYSLSLMHLKKVRSTGDFPPAHYLYFSTDGFREILSKQSSIARKSHMDEAKEHTRRKHSKPTSNLIDRDL